MACVSPRLTVPLPPNSSMNNFVAAGEKNKCIMNNFLTVCVGGELQYEEPYKPQCSNNFFINDTKR